MKPSVWLLQILITSVEPKFIPPFRASYIVYTMCFYAVHVDVYVWPTAHYPDPNLIVIQITLYYVFPVYLNDLSWRSPPFDAPASHEVTMVAFRSVS